MHLLAAESIMLASSDSTALDHTTTATQSVLIFSGDPALIEYLMNGFLLPVDGSRLRDNY
jgi:hypothetical protein